MLTLKNNSLYTDTNLIINNPDTILELTSDIDTLLFGVLTLSDGSIKTLQFINSDKIKKTRLFLTEADLPLLHKVNLTIHSVSDTGTSISNQIPVVFDINNISLNVSKNTSQELLTTLKELKLLENKINSIVANNRLLNINISNMDYIQPGMIPVAVDNKGNFVAQYPFANIVTKVNGQTAVDGVVSIDASMIQYNKEAMLDSYIKQLAESVKSVSEFVTTVSQTLMSTIESLQDLKLKVETHLDNGLI